MWHPLTADLLISRLSDPEQQALATRATAPMQLDVLNDIARILAAEWRGALRRVVLLDTRPDAVPDEVLIHILADFRYRAFTRLPGMRGLLDALRVDEWRRANTVRDNLKTISIEEPEDPYRPDVENSGHPGPAFIDPPTILETE